MKLYFSVATFVFVCVYAGASLSAPQISVPQTQSSSSATPNAAAIGQVAYPNTSPKLGQINEAAAPILIVPSLFTPATPLPIQSKPEKPIDVQNFPQSRNNHRLNIARQVLGKDACGADTPQAKTIALCENIIEARAAEFEPAPAPNQSAEEALLSSQRDNGANTDADRAADNLKRGTVGESLAAMAAAQTLDAPKEPVETPKDPVVVDPNQLPLNLPFTLPEAVPK